MNDETARGPVLVAVKNPAVVQQLVRTAGDLAQQGAGTVRLVTVAVKPHDSPFGVFDDETIVREFADDSHALLERAKTPAGVSVEREVVPARSAGKGILQAVDEHDPAALVVGWQGRTSRADVVFGTTVDTLVKRAPCDLYVERVGREAGDVSSVMLPVAGGPHVGPAAGAARAIALRNDASVLVFSVADPDDGDSKVEPFVDEGRTAILDTPGPDPTVESAIVEAPDVTDAIVDHAPKHDVIVMGSTRKSSLRRTLLGSVPRTVVDRVDETVILARAGRVADESGGETT